LSDSPARSLACTEFPAIDVTAGRLDTFWRTHAFWPLGLQGLAFVLIEAFGLDEPIARTLWFSESAQHWLGAGAGDWWARRLIHTDGGWLVRGIGAAALIAWLVTFLVPATRQWRRSAGFVVLAMAASVLVVGALKAVTNVDCPWDLSGFGGTHPYVALFADRPDYLPRAQCFPGAHASSGFSLLCFYFVLRNRSRRLSRLALWAACLVGVVFSIGQEARGAHFISHDLASAALVWSVQLRLYARVLGLRAAPARVPPRGRDDGSASSLRRRVLGGGLPAQEPENGAHDDHGDADAIADGRAPVVDPAHQQEIDVDESQHERTGAQQHQESTNTLHVSPLVD